MVIYRGIHGCRWLCCSTRLPHCGVAVCMHALCLRQGVRPKPLSPTHPPTHPLPSTGKKKGKAPPALGDAFHRPQALSMWKQAERAGVTLDHPAPPIPVPLPAPAPPLTSAAPDGSSGGGGPASRALLLAAATESGSSTSVASGGGSLRGAGKGGRGATPGGGAAKATLKSSLPARAQVAVAVRPSRGGAPITFFGS